MPCHVCNVMYVMYVILCMYDVMFINVGMEYMYVCVCKYNSDHVFFLFIYIDSKTL